MAILQHYYTSTRTPAKSGFQVKAQSLDIAPQVLDLIPKITGYRIPPTLVVDAIQTHPIAFRYFPTPQGEGILACIQSCGSDEYGRSGNSFAHTVIASTQELNSIVSPIFYWRSPFWINTDKTSQTQIPPLDSFNAEVVFDFDAMWQFLKVGSRHEWLHAMLSAAIEAGTTHRRLILIDESENIALWIAALTMALPTSSRPWFSFATYHHDPYVAPFIVTGTTADSQFRSNEDDYITYFVLNARDNRISQPNPSAYSDFVCDNFSADQYNNDASDLLEFFGWVEQRLANSQKIDSFLDDCSVFYQAGIKKIHVPNIAQVAKAADSIATHIATQSNFQKRDILDLIAARDIFANILTKNLDGTPEPLIKVLGTLRQNDPAFEDSAPKLATIQCTLIVQNREQAARTVQKSLNTLYSRQALRAAYNQSDLLDWLPTQLTGTVSQLQAFWDMVGEFIDWQAPSPARKTILRKTCVVLNQLATSDELNIPSPAMTLITAVTSTVGSNNPLFISVLSELKTQIPQSPVPEWVYTQLIRGMSLAERAPLRTIYREISRSIIEYELRQDITGAAHTDQTLTKLMAVTLDWVVGYDAPQQREKVLTRICEIAWKIPGVNHRQLATAFLNEENLDAYLPAIWRDKLAETVISDAMIAIPSGTVRRLYERFESHSEMSLSPTYQGIIQGSLALIRKTLSDSDVSNIHSRLAMLGADFYKQEAGRLVKELFITKPLIPTHLLLIKTLWLPKYKEVFWEIYWTRFSEELLRANLITETVGILEIWFTNMDQLLTNTDFVLPEFFMELPIQLEIIRKTREYAKVSRDFEAQLKKKSWGSLVIRYLPERKGLFR